MTPSLDLGAQMKVLERLSHEAGRSIPPVTVFLWELDESLVARCADLGAGRCAVYLSPQRVDVVEAFLERCRPLAARFAHSAP